MKQLLTISLIVALVMIGLSPSRALATAPDTLTIYATQGTLNSIINADLALTTPHAAYKLVSTDTTYVFDGAITSTKNISVIGVLKSGTNRPPCIQPLELPDFSIPASLFVLNANSITGTFKNVYFLGLATNNQPNAAGTAIQVSADHIKLVVDNCVFEEWLGFAIGYSGSWDKFFVTNCKFRNMNHPNQYYVGEAFRNEWSPNSAPTDSVVMDYNTFLCLNGYAACPVTKQIVNYIEFSHNDVIYTAKNPLFVFNATKAKVNNNIFYGTYAIGVNYTENPWWDNLAVPDTTYGIFALQPLLTTVAQQFDPADSSLAGINLADSTAKLAKLDSIAEKNRTIEVKNNVCFWPSGITNWWTSWNASSTWSPSGLNILTPTWMTPRTTAMFADKTHWPNLVQSGNVNVDPGFGTTVNNVLNNAGGGYGLGMVPWMAQIRNGATPTTAWGYKLTVVDSLALNWVPTWPLPETADLHYSATLTSTDGRKVGDPFWFTGTRTGVVDLHQGVPSSFSLSAPYPNPFNPTTTFEFSLRTAGTVSLKAYNVLGQVVATVVNGEFRNAGSYKVTVDMSHVASGVYFGVLEQEGNRAIQKMMLVK
jgi:hypothetical protein